VVSVLRYLLDTHTWLWAVLADTHLGTRARRALAGIEASERVGLAAISLKEAAWLLSRGRVRLTKEAVPWAAWLREAAAAPGLEVLPLTVDVAIESEQFPDSFPKDPADRLIAATARVHDLTLLTADRALHRQAGVPTLW
jgi:PIN domain nuclease of toxin-antitoxin system